MIASNRCVTLRQVGLSAIFTAALFAMSAGAHAQSSGPAQNYTLDKYGSHRVTHFLHNHNLPLVGAQILDKNDGSRELHLYGFVATPYGMKDAQEKALKYLGDPTINVVNSIQINPSIESMRPLSPDLPAAADTPVAPPPPSGGSNNQWDKAIDNIYKNGAQPLPQPSGPLLP